jgi:hypothetical protein
MGETKEREKETRRRPAAKTLQRKEVIEAVVSAFGRSENDERSSRSPAVCETKAGVCAVRGSIGRSESRRRPLEGRETAAHCERTGRKVKGKPSHQPPRPDPVGDEDSTLTWLPSNESRSVGSRRRWRRGVTRVDVGNGGRKDGGYRLRLRQSGGYGWQGKIYKRSEKCLRGIKVRAATTTKEKGKKITFLPRLNLPRLAILRLDRLHRVANILSALIEFDSLSSALTDDEESGLRTAEREKNVDQHTAFRLAGRRGDVRVQQVQLRCPIQVPIPARVPRSFPHFLPKRSLQH